MLQVGVYLEEADLAMLYDFRDKFYWQQIQGHFYPEHAELDPGSQSPMGDSYRKIEARL
jgi:hypothetical protein